MRRGLLKVVDKFKAEGAAELTAQIEAQKQAGRQAYADIERLETERRSAETFEAARAIDDEIARLRWAIERADATIPDLEARLADVKWEDRAAAFRKHKRLLAEAARKAIDLIERAAQANAEILRARHNASQELGDMPLLPLQWYGGILSPDLTAIWRRHTEQQLVAMETAELTRPPKPRPSGTPQAPYKSAASGPVVMIGGEIVSNRVEPPPPPKPVEAAPPPPPPSALAPMREPRRDGPPREGERQIVLLQAGMFNLSDGTVAKAGDRVNLPEAEARRFVETGAGDYRDPPAEVPAVIGDMKGEISASELLGAAP